ncbi:MAG: DUF4178 domain-containing protein [Sulfurovum sp.]|nr:DUF4178 domain-containing protein [Sulfurovum sp.]
MSNTFTVEKHFNCPQCGDSLALHFTHVKLVLCDSCKSTIFLENDATRLAGDSSVLSPEISIIHLNIPFMYAQKQYLPLGKIRYSYGRGFWEEWWLKDSANKEYWMSIDEGDVVLEQSITLDSKPIEWSSLVVGQILWDAWLVTELGTATCEGFEGSLPKYVSKGSAYAYAHLSGKDAQLMTLENANDGLEAYQGKWISLFDIKEMG